MDNATKCEEVIYIYRGSGATVCGRNIREATHQCIMQWVSRQHVT